MIKCFLVPMTEPPYSRENNQKPMYVDEIRCNWSGSPLFNAKYYVIKVNSTEAKLLDLQSKIKVIGFPDGDELFINDLTGDKKTKVDDIKKVLKLKDKFDENGVKINEKVKDFINSTAQCEGNFAWNKDLVFVPEEEV